MNKSTFIWLQIFAAILLLTAGTVIGTGLKEEGLNAFWKKVAFYEPAQKEEESPGDDVHGSDESIVELTESAISNLGLKTGPFQIRDYTRSIEIPAKVVERLPAGRREMTVPIAGTVSKVFIAPSQAIRAGDKLFELTVTDDAVSEAQVRLLNLMAEMEIAEKQLKRIKPLAEEGSVPGSRLLDAEFELSKLRTNYDAASQELLLRGLSTNQLEDLVHNKLLVKTLVVSAPELPGSQTLDTTNQWYTVEAIQALTGTNLKRGESLCTLTFHGELFIEGYAYESDLEKLTRIDMDQILIAAEFGESDVVSRRDGLRLHSINNHVDDESQTYPIYVAIRNEVSSERVDEQGRAFVSWRIKPGQRAHLQLPVESWEQQIVVPIDAIVDEGPAVYVFLKISHTHEHEGEVIQEFIRKSVRVSYRDKDFAIISPESDLDLDASYALDNAYFLNLALKQAASGGGHGHSHEH